MRVSSDGKTVHSATGRTVLRRDGEYIDVGQPVAPIVLDRGEAQALVRMIQNWIDTGEFGTPAVAKVS